MRIGFPWVVAFSLAVITAATASSSWAPSRASDLAFFAPLWVTALAFAVSWDRRMAAERQAAGTRTRRESARARRHGESEG